MYVPKSLNYTQLKSPTHLEACIIKLVGQQKSYNIAGTYASHHNQSSVNQDIEDLLNLPNTIIIGDWNAKHLSLNPTSNNQRGKILFNVINSSHTLIKPVGDLGSRPLNRGSSLLDFAITNIPNLHATCKTYNQISDHVPLIFELDIPADIHPLITKSTRRNLAKADWSRFTSLTKMEHLTPINTLQDIEQSIQEIKETIRTALGAVVR